VHEHDGPDTHPPRRIHGEQHHLEHHAGAAGTVALSDAIVGWWVLDDDHRARRREAALWASSGHAAGIFAGELYDVLAPTRGGYGRLQDFGIRFGNERVVLHIEPQAEAGRVQCNTARTTLLLDHEPLPWARWGEEFAAAMPAEILRLQERAAGTDCEPRREAIRSRVGAMLPLYRLSRYRPTRPHNPQPDEPATARPANESTGPPAPRRPAPSNEPAAHPTSASVQRQPDHSQAPADDRGDDGPSIAIVDLPDVAWISARDATRAPGDLEDQAARYHPARHELTINADFRAITDLLAHWRGRYRGVPGADAMIEAQVREWCEQILVEVVLAARNSHWSAEQLDALLSPSSFTAALLPRQLLHAHATETTRSEARAGAERSRRIHGRPGHGTPVSRQITPARKCAAAAARVRRAGDMSRAVPEQARGLAAALEVRFARDAELATELADAQRRLQRANDRLWSGLHPDGIAMIYGEHPAAVEVATAHNRSEILDEPDPLRSVQQVHWSIHQAFTSYQSAAERRRQLAAETGELAGELMTTLVGAGWSQQDARDANIRSLIWPEVDQ
jgi:hypothetical protein